MATTRVKIYNRALNLLGIEPISSALEDNKKTRALNAAWDLLVPELMLEEPWKFCTKEERLAQCDCDGIYDYGNGFQYPADCIVLLSPIGTTNEIQVLGDKIYTKDDTLTMRYVVEEFDISKWNAGFAKCLSYELAIECCFKLVESDSREEKLIEKYEKLVRPRAVASDVMQEVPQEMPNSLVEAGDEN